VPEPREDPPVVGAREPNVSLQVTGSVALYRKYPVVVAPLGVPEPFRVADVFVMLDAAFVVTVGGVGAVKLRTEPKAVPTGFEAIAQK
jgi:hypothetical protein